MRSLLFQRCRGLICCVYKYNGLKSKRLFFEGGGTLLSRQLGLLCLRSLAAVAGLLFLVSIVSCASSDKQMDYGIQRDFLGYVPARIAVLPCKQWPSSAYFDGLQTSLNSQPIIQGLCQRFSKFVLDGFKNQPYMNGYTPKAVTKLLQAARREALLDEFYGGWKKLVTDCKACKNPTSFYVNSISKRPMWRSWLNTLSRSTRNSDAVLVPFVLFLHKNRRDDRGVSMATVAGGVLLCLIDTNNGALVWSNARILEASNQVLTARASGSLPEFPRWEILFDRMLISNLWNEFPGRLVF